MKRILILICVLMLAALMFLAYKFKGSWINNKAVHAKNQVSKNISKPVANFISFTVDSAKKEREKFESIPLFSLDSVGWGKRYDIVSRAQRQSLDQPVLMIQPNQMQTPFLLYPGDSIRIRYAQSDTMQMYIPGDPVRSSELDFFRQLVFHTGNIYYFFTPMPYHQKVQSLAQIHAFETAIDSVKKSRIEFLAFYQKKNRIRDSFIKIAVNCIESTAIDDSLLLYQNNREQLVGLNLYTAFAKAKIASLERIGFQPYPMFIQASKHALAMVSGTNPHVGAEMDSVIFRHRFDFISSNLTGDHKMFSLAHTMNLAIKNNVDISPNYLNRFNQLCTDKGYLALVHTILDDNRFTMTFEKGANKLLSIDGKTVQDMKIVFQKYHGSLVFVDFWASWCAPCIQEIPFTRTLKKKYKNQKIVFVTISTDSQVSGWKKVANAEQLNGANDYLLLNSSNSTFIKQQKINSIPRYMLLDKTGKMLNNDTPRPSSEELSKLINKYL